MEVGSFLSVHSAVKAEEDVQKEEKVVEVSRAAKIRRTVALYMSFVSLGMVAGVLGPSLLDFVELTGSSLAAISWSFSSYSLGYLSGSAVAGQLVDRLLPSILLSVSLAWIALFTCVIPLSRSIFAIIPIAYLWGVGSGSLDTGGNVFLIKTWKDQHEPYMQALHFCFALGATLGPLVAEPFLSERRGTVDNVYNSTTNYSMYNVNVVAASSVPLPTSLQPKQESRILFAFLIIGAICVASFILFLLVAIQDARKNKVWKPKTNEKKAKNNQVASRKKILVPLLFLFFLSYVGMEEVLAAFIATFAVKQLDWSKSSGALLTSVYWGTFCVMRGAGIVQSKFFSPRQMQVGNLTVAVVATSLLCALVRSYPICTWPLVAVIGGSYASVFPNQISWTEKQVKFSGKMASLMLMGSSVGGFSVGPLFGWLIITVGPMSVIYGVLAASLLCSLLFAVMEVIVCSCKDAPAEAEPEREQMT